MGSSPTGLKELESEFGNPNSSVPVALPVPKTELQATIATMRGQYQEILSLPPHMLIEVIAPLGIESLGEFMLIQHIEAGKELLTRGATIRAINHEDKYNNLFVSLLKMRLSMIRWNLADQSRGGPTKTSGTRRGVSERDWVISQHGSDITIVEALRIFV